MTTIESAISERRFSNRVDYSNRYALIYKLPTGRELATLVHEYQTAGDHVALFNGIQLTSGVYIYRMTSGNYFSSKEMIILK
ncbi:MAG TPA: hypothetical protein VIS48_06810 [Candidatus Kryptonia bacterium]